MDKKLIGLIIMIVIVVITVSGCIDNNSSMDVFDSNHQINDASNEKEKDSESNNNNNNNFKPSENLRHDPEPNEEPEPPSNELQ
jgi:uncharacterized protein YxeA